MAKGLSAPYQAGARGAHLIPQAKLFTIDDGHLSRPDASASANSATFLVIKLPTRTA